MMKSMKSMMMGGAILLGLAMCLTSCEGTLDDVFGEWSRPTGNNSKQGDSSTTNATAITLDQTMKVLVKGGDALTIKIKFTPSDATDKTVTWESDDPTIATVENGVVTPVGLGIATITAKSGDLTATCEVFVGNEVALSAAAYEAKNYDILKGNMGANSLTIPAGCHVAFNGVNTNRQIICSGDATIYLTDGSENEVTVSTTNKAGIQIGGTGTTLTINGETAGDGKLTVQGGDGAAGIGTNLDSAGGNIVINGGTVTATGSGGGGAGIGTGETYTSTNECGTITINGGTVTATGGGYAAGIGTGYAYDKTNTCGAITINGGTVNATGGYYAAGIGTGYASNGGNNTCGAITIGTGVKSVTAKKSSSNPGPNSIGIGEAAYGGTQNCGTITIGGVVKAQSEFTGDTYTYTPAN